MTEIPHRFIEFVREAREVTLADDINDFCDQGGFDALYKAEVVYEYFDNQMCQLEKLGIDRGDGIEFLYDALTNHQAKLEERTYHQ